MAHHGIPGGRYNVFFPVFDFVFGQIQPALESTHAAAMARSVAMTCEAEGSVIIGALTQVALWIWLVGISIGVRYFWTTKAKM